MRHITATGYKIIAKVITETVKDENLINDLMYNFGNELKKDNPKFRITKFFELFGVKN